MPKLIELTIEIEVQKVSCPGVWLCQDGRVSLTIFALGTSYQTCYLPPSFPLAFRDVFYFRKRFQESCALNNICCLLKDEIIYCELVQWSESCATGSCITLAQYLGAVNDVLFPPNMCSSDGVDLLMRRTKDFPGILSPKIEISTKVRIDEVWNTCAGNNSVSKIVQPCHCPKDLEGLRQKQVCHSAQYHRTRCNNNSVSKTRSRSRSVDSRSCRSVESDVGSSCRVARAMFKPRAPSPGVGRRGHARCRQYTVYPVNTSDNYWRGDAQNCNENDDVRMDDPSSSSKDINKLLLESRYIDQELHDDCAPRTNKTHVRLTPCVCEICKKYHELFHSNEDS